MSLTHQGHDGHGHPEYLFVHCPETAAADKTDVSVSQRPGHAHPETQPPRLAHGVCSCRSRRHVRTCCFPARTRGWRGHFCGCPRPAPLVPGVPHGGQQGQRYRQQGGDEPAPAHLGTRTCHQGPEGVTPKRGSQEGKEGHLTSYGSKSPVVLALEKSVANSEPAGTLEILDVSSVAQTTTCAPD